jgi:hypothetical protein
MTRKHIAIWRCRRWLAAPYRPGRAPCRRHPALFSFLGFSFSPPAPASALPSGTAPSRLLGNNAAIAGQSVTGFQERRSEVRAERMRLRRTMRKITSQMCECADFGDGHHKCYAERMSRCGLGRVGDDGYVTVRVKQSTQYGRRASFRGIETCKSLSCPSCTGFLRERVAERLVDAAASWDKAGYAALFIVLTVSHGVSDSLADTYAKEAEAWRHITSTRQWKQLRAETGLELLRTTEITHGHQHGWHPHQNLFIIAPTTDVATLTTKVVPVLTRAWEKECQRRGFPPLSRQHGVHVEIVQSSAGIAEYVTKLGIGWEMVGGHAKQGHGDHRTYFQILADYRERPSQADLDLIHEHIRVTRGRRMLNASRGFWQLMGTVGIGEVSEDDDEDQGEEVEDVGRIPAECWDRVVRIWGLDGELLKAVELGGRDAVIRLLGEHKAWLVDARGMPIWPARAGPPPARAIQGELELAL